MANIGDRDAKFGSIGLDRLVNTEVLAFRAYRTYLPPRMIFIVDKASIDGIYNKVLFKFIHAGT